MRLFEDIRERLEDLKCRQCGSKEVAIARDMLGTRHCKCGNTWIPLYNKDAKRLLKALDLAVEGFSVDGDDIACSCCGSNNAVQSHFNEYLTKLKQLSEET